MLLHHCHVCWGVGVGGEGGGGRPVHFHFALLHLLSPGPLPSFSVPRPFLPVFFICFYDVRLYHLCGNLPLFPTAYPVHCPGSLWQLTIFPHSSRPDVLPIWLCTIFLTICLSHSQFSSCLCDNSCQLYNFAITFLTQRNHHLNQT